MLDALQATVLTLQSVGQKLGLDTDILHATSSSVSKISGFNYFCLNYCHGSDPITNDQLRFADIASVHIQDQGVHFFRPNYIDGVTQTHFLDNVSQRVGLADLVDISFPFFQMHFIPWKQCVSGLQLLIVSRP